MNIGSITPGRKQIPVAHSWLGSGLVALVALVTMFAVATTQAVETGQNRAVQSGNNADSPNAKDMDTKDMDTKDMDTKDTGAKEAGVKEAKAKKTAGPPPSKLWIVNTLRSHPELVIF